MELPATAATWWWGALGTTVAAAAVWRRSGWLWYWAGALLAATIFKWAGFDALYGRLTWGTDTAILPVLNWRVAAAVLLTPITLIFVRLVATRCPTPPRQQAKRDADIIKSSLVLLAAGVILWSGSFEIDRYFALDSVQQHWRNPDQAMQMAYSLWWATYAAIILAIGFTAAKPMLRYLALAIFGVTLAKVFLHDMAEVETIFRILALSGVGALMLVAALLYNRHFRQAPQQLAAPQPASEMVS